MKRNAQAKGCGVHRISSDVSGRRASCRAVPFVWLALQAVYAGPVIPDYQFKMVADKPGVIPFAAPNTTWALGISNPNPADTGAGAGQQYLALYGKNWNYDQRIAIVHRNDVTAYDDFEGKNAAVAQINNGNDMVPQDDGRTGSVTGPVLRVFAPIGRMTHENYWINATGGSKGPYNEWQPRDAREGATFNTFLIYPDADAGADGLGVHHTTTDNDNWGIEGYNKKGSTYVATINAGEATERIRGITWGEHYSSYAWGAGIFEVGPWTAPANPETQLGTRSKASSAFFMNATQLGNLVPDVNDAFRSLFSDGTHVFFLTGGAGDSRVYLSAVEITDWATAAWEQVDISSGEELYQSFTFNSGTAGTSLLDGGGFVFAPDPDNPGGAPLLYIGNAKNRIFVLEAVSSSANGTLIMVE